jgi:hypothetical protein
MFAEAAPHCQTLLTGATRWPGFVAEQSFPQHARLPAEWSAAKSRPHEADSGQ